MEVNRILIIKPQNSYTRFCCSERTQLLHLEIPEFAVQDILFNDRPTLVARLCRIYLHFM